MKTRLRNFSFNVHAHRASLAFAMLLSLVFGFLAAQAQVEPALVWSTNVGARPFAVDAQTNVYANSGSNIIILNRAGVPLSTNQICPIGGLAQRDAAGNYYFAGSFTPPVDFGGVTLSTGNAFLAKYSPMGVLSWAVPLYGSGRSISVSDLRLDPDGAAYVGYWIAFSSFIHSGPMVSRFDNTGTMSWVNNAESHNDGNPSDVRFSDFTTSGGLALLGYSFAPQVNSLATFDAAGNRVLVTSWYGDVSFNRPVLSSSGQIFTIEYQYVNGEALLTKRTGSGALLWTKSLGYQAVSTTAPDENGGLYINTSPTALSDFDANGNVVWSLPMPGVCREVIPDGQGNLFVWMANGAIGRVTLFPSMRLTGSCATVGPNGFTLTFNGGAPFVWHVQGSSNLVDWVDLGTVTNNTGTGQFTDPGATNSAYRIYRLSR